VPNFEVPAVDVLTLTFKITVLDRAIFTDLCTLNSGGSH